MIASGRISYFARRLLGSIVLLVIVLSVVFIANRQIGDPALMVLGVNATEEDVADVRERMGLNDPFLVQYGRFLKGMATGDMGGTFRFGMTGALTHGDLPDSRATLPIAAERLPRLQGKQACGLFVQIRLGKIRRAPLQRVGQIVSEVAPILQGTGARRK